MSTRGLNPIKISSYQENFLIIGISVGSEKFEGEHLLALIRSINQLFKLGKVNNCMFAVADTLQRYNYMIDGKTTEETAFDISQKAGDAWEIRNAEIIKQLDVPYKITRWNKWLKSEEYKKAFFNIINLLNRSSSFELAISKSVAEFSSRFKNRYEKLGFKNAVNNEDLKKSCRAYLL